MRLKLISCEVLYRELLYVVSRSPNMVDVEFLPKGLHDIGAKPMRERLQAVVDRVDGSKYEAILLGYGLCNNGLAGLQARDIPLILPRAHDCITLFLGSRQRYMEYFHSQPGVYFKTTGWMERGDNPGELSQLSIQRQTGMDRSLEELIAKYGEENARYLYETLCQYTHNYSQFTFIEMGVEPDDRFEKQVQEEAKQRGWRYAKLQGDMGMFERLVNGPWDAKEFLTIPPGYQVAATYEEEVVTAVPTVPSPEAP
jgi:hypothetical protein